MCDLHTSCCHPCITRSGLLSFIPTPCFPPFPYLLSLLSPLSLFSLAAATLSYGTHSNTLANPERGFYTGSTGSKLSSTFRASPKTNETLLLVSAFLDGFQTAELSDAKIADIAAGLDTIKKAGVKAIFRIAYDSDGGAPCPDPTLEMAIRHIEQLQPVMDSYKDVIAFIQAGQLSHRVSFRYLF